MSFYTATNAELLYTLPAAVTKNTYTTEAVFSAVAGTTPVCLLPGNYFIDNRLQRSHRNACILLPQMLGSHHENTQSHATDVIDTGKVQHERLPRSDRFIEYGRERVTQRLRVAMIDWPDGHGHHHVSKPLARKLHVTSWWLWRGGEGLWHGCRGPHG